MNHDNKLVNVAFWSITCLIIVLFFTACCYKGDKGDTGTTGPLGPPGINGLDGSNGSNGAPGQPCTSFKTGNVTTIGCPDSAPVSVVDGLNGAPGTVITPVQLCPGTTSYPSVFLEYALCVSGQLYGVYSVNGGFLALLPPGNYNSNAVGSSCTFAIGANCQVSY